MRMSQALLRVLLILLYVIVCGAEDESAGGEEENLVKHLFLDNVEATARKIVRPPGVPVKIDFGYSAISITSFDEINGYISIYAWEQVSWLDSRLAWNESLYVGVKNLKMPTKYIWMPDITSYGSSTGNYLSADEDPEHGLKAVIQSNGHVMYVPKRNFNFRCSMDLTDFPYDNQTCTMSLSSWVHDSSHIMLNVGEYPPQISGEAHSDWKVANASIDSVSMKYSCCPESYQTVTLTLRIKRNPHFYFYIFIVPAAAMLFILPMIHFFPPGCSQKTTLAGLLMVCSLLLHLMAYQQLRGETDVKGPKLIRHYDNHLIMIIISIAISSFTSSLANAVHTSRRVPAFLRKVMNTVIAKICCFRSADVKGEFTQLGASGSANIRYNRQNDMIPIVNEDTTADTAASQADENSAVQYLVDELRYNRERRQLEMEWYQLALLVDRLTAIMFIIYPFAATADME